MTLKLVLPKGRINTKVLKLLADCGIDLIGDDRNYRPRAYGFDLEVKLLKSQNIPSLVEKSKPSIQWTLAFKNQITPASTLASKPEITGMKEVSRTASPT